MTTTITTEPYEPSVQDFLMKKVQEGLQSYDIHESCSSAIQLYVEYGILPGSFLQAVLANDFLIACLTADFVNKTRLTEYAYLLSFYLPSECWGSSEKIKAWNERGGLKGRPIKGI